MIDYIRHIESRHGINGEADRSMANADDIAKIGFVLDNYDEVVFLKNEKGEIVRNGNYNTKYGKPAPLLLYVKKINGFYCVVEAVNDGRRKRLDIITAYRCRKNPLK